MANHENAKHQHHHILPNKHAFAVYGALLFFTWVTVAVAKIDLGSLNMVVAMLVAAIKASLVAMIFMNLKWDRRENLVIFMASFLFLAIFIVFTATDLFFRGEVYTKPGQPLLPQVAQAAGGGKFKTPWVSSPELVGHGKTVFEAQCATCHGVEGKGNGVAASGMNPPPRNFTSSAGWKNGRMASGIFKTLKEGIPGTSMASYASLPAEDRWALAYYVLHFGGDYPKEPAAELAKLGGGGGAVEAPAPSIPVDFAIRRMIEK